MRSVSIIAAVMLSLVAVSIRAADSTEVDSSSAVDTAAKVDTVLYQPRGQMLSSMGVRDTVDYEHKLTQNPTAALFKSMVVPGLGQLGNRRYFKAIVVIGLQSWFISSAVHYGRAASDYRKQFNESTDMTERNLLYDRYLDKKDSRNKFTWFAVIVTFVSMFDAYADAHLSGFPKDEKQEKGGLGWKLGPGPKEGVYAAATWTF